MAGHTPHSSILEKRLFSHRATRVLLEARSLSMMWPDGCLKDGQGTDISRFRTVVKRTGLDGWVECRNGEVDTN